MVQRYHFGPYNDGVIGLKVALPGFDVSVEADDNNPQRRSFNSRWPAMAKIAAVVRANGTTVFHGLGFVPHFEARPVTPGSPYIFNNDVWSGIQNVMWPRIDANVLVFIGHPYPGGAAYSGASVSLFWKYP